MWRGGQIRNMCLWQKPRDGCFEQAQWVLLDIWLNQSWLSISQTPQQSNSYDCGLFVLTKQATIAFNQSRDFTPENMMNVRRHIALQLYAGQVYLPHYPGSQNGQRSADITALGISSETAHAAHILLDLSTLAQRHALLAPNPSAPVLKHHVRFDSNVNVQEFLKQEA